MGAKDWMLLYADGEIRPSRLPSTGTQLAANSRSVAASTAAGDPDRQAFRPPAYPGLTRLANRRRHRVSRQSYLAYSRDR